MMATKFKIEVVADRTGKWCGNAAEYDTFDEARREAIDLANRWYLVQRARVVGFSEERGVESETVVFG